MIQLTEIVMNEHYDSPEGIFMKRDSDEKGFWSLYSAEGKRIDGDQYRNEIAFRHNLTLVDLEDI